MFQSAAVSTLYHSIRMISTIDIDKWSTLCYSSSCLFSLSLDRRFQPCRKESHPTLARLPRASKGSSLSNSLFLFFSSLATVRRLQPTIALSPLAATLMDLPASVANKRLTDWLSHLDATLTKNRGVGSAPLVRLVERLFVTSLL